MDKCIIFGAGEYCNLQWNRKQNDLVIAADGGYQKLMELGENPDVLIGDMDSLNDDKKVENARKKGIEVVILPVCKDDTDMLAAIKYGLSKGYLVFELYGALGGRLDHTIANIQCLSYLNSKGAKGFIIDDYMCTQMISNERMDFSEDMRGMISVFAFGGNAEDVTISGLKYEVNHGTLSHDFPIGVSNEFVGKKSYVEVKKGMLLLHYTYR